MVIIRNIIHIGKKDSYPSLNPALHFTPKNLKIFLSKTFERKKNKIKWKKELLNFLEFAKGCFSVHAIWVFALVSTIYLLINTISTHPPPLRSDVLLDLLGRQAG